jgi:hypothetical protein
MTTFRTDAGFKLQLKPPSHHHETSHRIPVAADSSGRLDVLAAGGPSSEAGRPTVRGRSAPCRGSAPCAAGPAASGGPSQRATPSADGAARHAAASSAPSADGRPRPSPRPATPDGPARPSARPTGAGVAAQPCRTLAPGVDGAAAGLVGSASPGGPRELAASPPSADAADAPFHGPRCSAVPAPIAAGIRARRASARCNWHSRRTQTPAGRRSTRRPAPGAVPCRSPLSARPARGWQSAAPPSRSSWAA